jgi:hypothetical protein
MFRQLRDVWLMPELRRLVPAYFLGRKLTWNGSREQIVGDEEAQQMLSRPQREPYQM